MTILLIEDDENKLAQIEQFTRELFKDAEMVIAGSYRSGLQALIKQQFNLIIMDMSMPTYEVSTHEEGGRPQAYAGRELLRQMTRRGICTPVLVVTQYDRFGEGVDSKSFEQLHEELRAGHPEIYLGMVYYNSALEGWKEEFAERLSSVELKDRGRQ